jgi:hypothetical protein
MFHVEPDHIEAQLARNLGQPRFGDAINSHDSYKTTSTQLAS